MIASRRGPCRRAVLRNALRGAALCIAISNLTSNLGHQTRRHRTGVEGTTSTRNVVLVVENQDVILENLTHDQYEEI